MRPGTGAPRFIDGFDVILLDVQKTFMFGVDRFGPEENFADTYRAMGGDRLGDAAVNAVIRTSFEYLISRYDDPAYFDDFPSLDQAMAAAKEAEGLDPEEMRLLQRTFARHECGTISPEYAGLLMELAATHRLGIVSNIWASKDTWLDEFRGSGILHLFEKMVFSSDFRSIKPSPALFREAVEAFDAPLDRILFVGDSPAYDIAGAKGAGLAAVLTLNHGPIPDLDPPPDRMLDDLFGLIREPL